MSKLRYGLHGTPIENPGTIHQKRIISMQKLYTVEAKLWKGLPDIGNAT
jgi:hypothetical protein